MLCMEKWLKEDRWLCPLLTWQVKLLAIRESIRLTDFIIHRLLSKIVEVKPLRARIDLMLSLYYERKKWQVQGKKYWDWSLRGSQGMRFSRTLMCSTDAKIQAIERKLAALQNKSSSSTRSPPPPSSSTNSKVQPKSIRSALSTEATTSGKSSSSSSSSKRFKPY